MQKGRNASALAMELRLFCIKPSECTAWYIYMVVLWFAISSFRVVSNDIVSHIQSYSVASLALENMHNWVPDLLECTVYLVHFSGSWYNCAYLSWDAFERGNPFHVMFHTHNITWSHIIWPAKYITLLQAIALMSPFLAHLGNDNRWQVNVWLNRRRRKGQGSHFLREIRWAKGMDK